MVIHIRKSVRRLLGAFCIALGILALWYGVLHFPITQTLLQSKPSSSAITPAIHPEKPMIALTFDDGPYAPSTNRILEALSKVHGKATFFVVGNRIAGREKTIQNIQKSGSEIGNHTFDHVFLRDLSEKEILEQIEKTDVAVKNVTGKKPTLLRPPGGIFPKHVQHSFSRPVVLWSLDTMDWSHQNAQKTVQTVLKRAKDGDIILMHDLFLPTAEAAETLIPELTKRGFQLVTVSELIKYREDIAVKLFENAN